VLIWRGWGILGRLGCYIGLHVLAAPAWIVLIVTGLDGNDTGHRATRIYLLAVMVGFIIASLVVRPRTLELQARRREAIRQAAERLGYATSPYARGGQVISDPPPPTARPKGPDGISPRSPGSGERD